MLIEQIIQRSRRLLVITGAGCSVPSGIGDYRDERGEWKRTAPVTHQEFMTSLAWRQRYWARSQAGFPAFQQARPNDAHRVLARWEQAGRLAGLITQNVDRLHQRAGHERVIDLHGRLDQVVCMDCRRISSRALLQGWLDRHNTAPPVESFDLGADGDALLAEQDFTGVAVPDCPRCGGILKPNVVFFGDAVPRGVVDEAYRLVDGSDAVLVVGSSLMVFSSYRFVRRAASSGIPIVAINQGRTRADDLLAAKVEADCVATLLDLANSAG